MPAASTPAASPWAALLPTALAGTRRQPFAPLPGLTPALGSEADAPEKQLLLTAAGLALVQQAAGCPLPGPAELLPPAPAETRPAVPRAAVRRLEALLATEPVAEADSSTPPAIVLERALFELSQSPYRLPAALTARLLHHPWARYLRSATIRQALGERAYWLTELTADDPVPLPAGQAHRPNPATAVVWSSFDHLAHRMQFPLAADNSYLAEFRRQPPKRRTQLLWRAWQRNAGLALPPPLQADLDALLAATPPAQRPWSKLAELPGLGGHPRLAGHPLLTQLAEWAAPLLVLQQPAAGPVHVQVTVPRAWPEAWQQAGLKPWSRHFKGHRDAGLQELLYHLGPWHWVERWQLPPAEVVSLVAAAPRGQLVLDAWSYSLAASDYAYWPQPELARALLAAGPAATVRSQVQLLPHLPLPEQLAWLAAALPPNLAAPAVPDWAQHLETSAGPLTTPAGLRLLLPTLAAALTQPRTAANADQCLELPHLLHYLAEYAPASTYPEALAALGDLRPLHPRTAPALALLLQSLALRHDLLQACQPTPAPA